MFPLGFSRSCSSLFLVSSRRASPIKSHVPLWFNSLPLVVFSMIDLHLKVAAFFVQWDRGFAVSHCSWVSFLSFWCPSRLCASALDVLSRPDAFFLKSLPYFYCALLSAWQLVAGSFSCCRSSLVIASLSPYHVAPVSSISSKSNYLFLLSEDHLTPHCVDKFFPQFGILYWPSTWSQLFFFKLDGPIIDLN